MAGTRGRSRRPQGARRDNHRAVALAVLLLTLACFAMPAAAASPSPGSPGEWTKELATLEAPYSEATGITASVLSEDGNVLVIGTDNGGVIFFSAETGALLDAAETSSHGAVVDIRLDAIGLAAAIVYEDGYVAVIGRNSETPLLTLQPETGGDPRPSAVLDPKGHYLVVARSGISLYHLESGPEAKFRHVATDAGGAGPFVWFHREFLFFGALAPNGEVSLYSYSQNGLNPQGTRDITEDDDQVTALAVSGDGNRFAIALESGAVTRYTPSLNPQAPQLIPDYQGQTGGAVLGLALDHDGQRLAAWSGRELLWVDGCNQNTDLCGGKTTERDTVQLRPPGFGTTFTSAALTPDLSRALLQIEDTTRERRLYNLPSLDHFVMDGEGGTTGRSLLSHTGTTVFLADGTTLSAKTVSPADLPLPESQVVGDPHITGGGGDDGDGDAFLLGLSTEVFLFTGIGILALLLLVVLGSVVMAMRRGSAARAPALPSLAPAKEETFASLAAPPTGGLGARPGSVRVVAPSAPATAPPPEGLLVLQQVGLQGPGGLAGLDLAVHRPEVLRVSGDRSTLDAFASLLGGRLPFGGTLSVGGASARDTPTLYARRVRVGLDAEHAPGEDAAALFRGTAVARGLPLGLVERRMQKDLGWMGDRLHRPVGELRPLDRWKVRLALALVDRPHMIVLRVSELPWHGEGAERVVTLRRVLSGIARHYETLVVLLDDGTIATDTVRRVADEEIRLSASGFSERRLLEDGRPVRHP